jgi:hypothetical protein
MKLDELGVFDLNQKTKGGNTATHLAAMHGHSALVVDFLVGQKGALLATRNNKNQNVCTLYSFKHWLFIFFSFFSGSLVVPKRFREEMFGQIVPLSET